MRNKLLESDNNFSIMKTEKIILVFLFLCTYSINLCAQKKEYTGTVTTLGRFPVNQAEVLVTKTGTRTMTDSLGNFTILCVPKSRLTIKAEGFQPLKAKVKDSNKELKFNLKLIKFKEADKIAIGYGHINADDVIYARNHLRFKNPMSKYNDIFDMIRNKIPGVEIIDNREIRIRGEKTFQGSNAALIVVDGVIADMGVLTSIPLNDIRSIDVLKGPDATVYGSRGANGVVLLTTKNASN